MADNDAEMVEFFKRNYDYEGKILSEAVRKTVKDMEQIEAAPDIFINDTLEDRVNYLMEKRIEYTQEDGKIYFKYYATFGNAEREGSYSFRLEGRIPEEIQKRGEKAIRNYAQERLKDYLTMEIQQHKKDEDFEKNPDFPIAIEYDGQKLEGKIVLAKARYFRVRLEQPLKGEMNSLSYGFASAMAGHHIFTRDENNNLSLSEMTINDAKNILIKIYKAEKNKLQHGEAIKLVKELNQDQE